MYRSFTLLVKFIPKNYDVFKAIVYTHFFSWISLIVCCSYVEIGHIFTYWFLCCVTSYWNYVIVPQHFGGIFKVFLYKVMLSAATENFILLCRYGFLSSFSWLISLPRICSNSLNKSHEREHSFLVPDRSSLTFDQPFPFSVSLSFSIFVSVSSSVPHSPLLYSLVFLIKTPELLGLVFLLRN